MIRAGLLTLTLSVMLTTGVAAQQDEEPGGMLVDLLESTLSGESRSIKVIGLDGALSSRATIREITVSDDAGVWLTITDAVLDWNRLALLRGRFSVNSLTADEIVVSRRPNPAVAAEVDLPDPEAQPFAVPELPVSVTIEDIAVNRISLGEPVVGLAAELALEGSVILADGALDTTLALTRLDRPTDSVALTAKYENQTKIITLDLLVAEDAGGLISTVLKVPDGPSLRLAAQGQGPVSDFTADIGLASNGTERVSGQVRLRSVQATAGDDAEPDSIAFTAGLEGDFTPLLSEDYRGFFGDQAQLNVAGRRDADGRLEVSEFDIASNALVMNGDLAISGTGVIEKVLLSGRIAPPDGNAVVLPIGAPRTTINAARVSVRLDAATDNTWDVNLSLDGLSRPDLTLRQADVRASGTLEQAEELKLRGRLSAGLNDLQFADPALVQATGETVTLDAEFAMLGNGVFELPKVDIAGSDYSASFQGVIDGLETGFAIDGTGSVRAADIGRFSGLAGRQLGGAVTARATGSGSPLGGMFDVSLDARAENLVTGESRLDPLVTGVTTLELAAKRDETGLTLDAFQLDGTALSAMASGALSTNATDLKFGARLDDLARLLPDFAGPAKLEGNLRQDETGTWSGLARLDGPSASFAKVAGSLQSDGKADLVYDVALDRVERLVPEIKGSFTSQGTARRVGTLWNIDSVTDGTTGISANLTAEVDEKSFAGNAVFDARLDDLARFSTAVSGPATIDGKLGQDENGVIEGQFRLDGPSRSYADLSGTVRRDGDAEITFFAALTRIERFVPDIVGTVRSEGKAQRKGTKWAIDGIFTGPAEIDGKVAGTIDEASQQADVAAAGQAQLGILNRILSPNSINGLAKFDLALRGDLELNALSGTLSTAGTTVVIPALAQTINNLGATITVAQSQANVAVNAAVRAGGGFRVSGPIELSPPFQSRITTDIQNVVLTDNISYDTSMVGQLVYDGRLLGNGTLSGEILFPETNINLATASGSVGAAAIPELTHVGEGAKAYQTRENAGLTAQKTESGGPVFGLDILLNAPNKVFARGRGLQAELGGAITIGGTTANIQPAGTIELIRGNFDLLGRRLRLTEGQITMQGSLLPILNFEATTSTSEGDATLRISGPLTSPDLEVESSPDRPTEEALAMLVFGDGFADLSPLKLAQLAAQLAQLSGAGTGANDKAREGLGVDTLDLGTDDNGNAQVGAGAYISEDVYTEIVVNTQGETELNLNFDLTDSFTIRGNVDNAGETGVGLFFERDY